jgi:transposase
MAATMYPIVRTVKFNDLNPKAYLRDMLAKIAEGHPISRIDELMPWRGQAADNRHTERSPR